MNKTWFYSNWTAKLARHLGRRRHTYHILFMLDSMASICWKEGLENIIQASTKVGCVENRSNSNIPKRTLILAEKKKMLGQ